MTESDFLALHCSVLLWAQAFLHCCLPLLPAEEVIKFRIGSIVDLIDFAPRAIEEPKSEPLAKRLKQSSIAGFFAPKFFASSSSSSSSSSC